MLDTVETPRQILITPPNFQRAAIRIRGTAPYMQHKFSAKVIAILEAKHREGSVARKGKKRDPRNFEEDYLDAMHVSTEGWPGIPAPSFRNAAISACRIKGFAMTRAKLSIFIEADGYDKDDRSPLVRIEGTPERNESYVRNETGVVDLRWRPMWPKWEATVNTRWDADQFSAEDILNLFACAGMQVGIGEGRPDSPKSNGLGLGLWEILP